MRSSFVYLASLIAVAIVATVNVEASPGFRLPTHFQEELDGLSSNNQEGSNTALRDHPSQETHHLSISEPRLLSWPTLQDIYRDPSVESTPAQTVRNVLIIERQLMLLGRGDGNITPTNLAPYMDIRQAVEAISALNPMRSDEHTNRMISNWSTMIESRFTRSYVDVRIQRNSVEAANSSGLIRLRNYLLSWLENTPPNVKSQISEFETEMNNLRTQNRQHPDGLNSASNEAPTQ
ncbi:hypothetical protein BJ684DRAFT_14269 [Piptocephalis cylindrospora]|uniref:Uncharacterized protein n=1 Tax=Piptocephalis cylindrospora TaxID=1907219 RepID=A0A4P9Y9I0_9FUNG|nr:hypothetical protein BJ684DRAFT_14269 [Piptocephalis cylindrospora]|eukprot:RKP15514.1 hypothetical protein BJ684DRAFT_14269 [Piptocephalis cylindrospora]